MKKFFKEFKEFITKGNILDMAVGVIIGGAFNTIVQTLNKQVLMPIVNCGLSYISGGSELCTVLPNNVLFDEAIHSGATPIVVNGVSYYSVNYINWSAFIESIINFLFVALTLFVIVKVATGFAKRRAKFEEELRKKKESKEEQKEEVEEPSVVEPSTNEILSEIRDLLKNKDE